VSGAATADAVTECVATGYPDERSEEGVFGERGCPSTDCDSLRFAVFPFN